MDWWNFSKSPTAFCKYLRCLDILTGAAALGGKSPWQQALEWRKANPSKGATKFPGKKEGGSGIGGSRQIADSWESKGQHNQNYLLATYSIKSKILFK